jgi:hypothetical protein
MEEYHEIFTPIPCKKRSLAYLKFVAITFIVIIFFSVLYGGFSKVSTVLISCVGLIFYFKYLWHSSRDKNALIEIKISTYLEIKYLKRDAKECFKSDLKDISVSKSYTLTTPPTFYLKITSKEKILRFFEYSSEELDSNKIEIIRKKINELKKRSIH